MVLNNIYINGTGVISIQKPLSNEGVFDPLAYHEPYVRCIEPNFKDYFEPIVSRRMSRIIKRAIVSAKHAIKESGIEKPDAIITGTGLGCVEDTEKFLDAMIRNEEKFLQPAYFIQSTHNTISSQIAINLNCNGYNNTYIHRGVSFENALIDAALLFRQKQIHTALVTGNDELTPSYFTLLRRLGYWKESIDNSLQIIGSKTAGSFSGEGSLSFIFSDQKSTSSYAMLRGIDLFYRPSCSIGDKIKSFLADFNLLVTDIDVFMTGMNGDSANDIVYDDVCKEIFTSNQIGIYKHVCGEFYTSAAYGLLVASCCLQKNEVPSHLMLSGNAKKQIRHILLYNHFRNKDHSLILLSLC